MSVPTNVVGRLRDAITKLYEATQGIDGDVGARDEEREADEALDALLAADPYEAGRALGWAQARETLAGMLFQEAFREDALYDRGGFPTDEIPVYSRRALHSVRAEVLRDWAKIAKGAQ